MSARLVADSVHKTFHGRPVLRGAWIQAAAGTITYLLGRNGCGKTTLLKCIAGIAPYDRGFVAFEGERYDRPRLHVLAAAGLWLMPSGGVVMPAVRVDAHLRMLARRFGDGRIREAVEMLGIGRLLSSKCADLSGGERRHVELALAVARAPTCLIADEPLLGLDPKDRELCKCVLRRLAEEGCAVVVTGHELADLASLPDEVLFLSEGETRRVGEGRDAVSIEQLRQTLDTPPAWTQSRTRSPM